MSINEKLAELCGYPYTTNDLGGFVERATCKWIVWNPTADLNQLKMCYEAAKATVEPVQWYANFREALAWGIRDYDENNRAYHMDFFEVWVDRPELVAQAILKAKGVS